MPYNISIVIVNYNGKRYIDNLFQSFINLDVQGVTYEIVFVDNNSSDDSVLYLTEKYQDLFPSLKIVKSEKNLGFAGGNNFGVQFAEGEYVVFLNNDTAVSKNWLQELSLFSETHSDIGIVSSKLIFFYDFIKLNINTHDKVFLSKGVTINGQKYTIDPKFTENVLYGENDITCFGHTTIYVPLINVEETGLNIEFDFVRINNSNIDSWVIEDEILPMTKSFTLTENVVSANKLTLVQNAGSGINEKFDGYDIGFCEVDKGQYNNVYELDSSCGAAMMINKGLFDKVGGFDERFFMYYEDTDLSYRIKKLGFKLYFCPTAVVRHIHTGSSQEWSPFFVYHIYRNKLIFIYKNFPLPIFCKQFARYVWHVLKETLTTRQKPALKKAKIKALFGFIKLLPFYIKKGKTNRGVL
ncbi:glycosyltransferase family 2 protein [Paenibacillus sp. FSL E2-0178]|uniref:glycosyltransferase family 2 protein n=1 Tax=Paenibacillus sp. FSL E2-0178 TaxID=2921361 RepID=UPI0031586050